MSTIRGAEGTFEMFSNKSNVLDGPSDTKLEGLLPNLKKIKQQPVIQLESLRDWLAEILQQPLFC